MKKAIFLILIALNVYGQIIINRASKLDSTLLTTQYRLDTTRAGLISLMDNFSVDDTLYILQKDSVYIIIKDSTYVIDTVYSVIYDTTQLFHYDTTYIVQYDTTTVFSFDTIYISANIPKGTIAMWSGSIDSIPIGWQLCDGTNGTPDLRDRFIVGAGNYYAIGNTGGQDSVQLTIEQIPSHTHIQNPHSHSLPAYGNNITSATNNKVELTSSTINYTASTNEATATNQYTGGSGYHENRPKYYSLAYIMKMTDNSFSSGSVDTNIIATKNYVESRVDTRLPISAIDVDVPSVYSVDTAKSNLYAEIYTTRNMIPLEPLENGDSVIAIIDSTKTRKFITIDNFPDSTKTRKFISIDNFPDSTKTRKYVAIDHIVRTDTVAIAYNNRLLEMQVAGAFGFKCDTISTKDRNLLSGADRDTTKTMYVDNIIIQTDSTTIGYVISVKKLKATAYTKVFMRNERLTGNVTVNLNFIGAPLILKPYEHLYIQKLTPYGDTKAKCWVSLKYRVY